MKNNNILFSLDAQLKDLKSPAYIVDNKGTILHCNIFFLEALNLEKKNVIGKKLSQLSRFLPSVIHQNNIALMKSGKNNCQTLEAFKPKYRKTFSTWYAQKKLIKNDRDEVIALLNISHKEEPQNKADKLSWQTKHQIREALNAIYGNIELNILEKNRQAIKSSADKIRSIVDTINVVDDEFKEIKGGCKQWIKILWISDEDNTFLPFDGSWDFVKIDSASAIEIAKKGQIRRKEYQIILIDAPLLKNLPYYGRFFDADSLTICVGKDHAKRRHGILPQVQRNILIAEWQVRLPRMWFDFVCRSTMRKVAKTNKLNVLSVEDNEDSRNSLKMLLDYYGFVVLDEAASVAATKQKIRDNAFDLIILDLGLPDMSSGDDYALSRLIRQIQKQKGDFCCPIIVNTGHGFLARNTYSKEELLFIHGINEFFVKPNLLINRDSMFARYIPEEFKPDF